MHSEIVKALENPATKEKLDQARRRTDDHDAGAFERASPRAIAVAPCATVGLIARKSREGHGDGSVSSGLATWACRWRRTCSRPATQVRGLRCESGAGRRAAAAGGAGGRRASRLAAAGADVVITMLPAGQQVREVYLGDGGVLAAVGAGTLLIDCSTIDVETARVVAAAAQAQGPCRCSMRRCRAASAARRPARSPSWSAAATRPSRAPSRSWKRWARPSCMPAGRATARRRKSATT